MRRISKARVKLGNQEIEQVNKLCYLGSTVDEWEGGIVLGDTFCNIRYADDTTLLAATEEEIKYLTEKIKEVSKKVGLIIIQVNTKMIIIGQITPKAT